MFINMNGLEKTFWVLGILSIVGGFALGAMLGPGDPQDGYQWKTVAYLPMLICMLSGLVSGFIFMAVARIVFHLRTIAEELRLTRERVVEASVRESFPIASSNGPSVQTPGPSLTKATVWACKKCGVTNPMKSNQCKGCAEYR